MIRACSHLVIATDNVPRMTKFFAKVFATEAHFRNKLFAEFILPSKFRVAFFKPVGPAAKYFESTPNRGGVSFGVTVDNVDAVFEMAGSMKGDEVQVSGPPKDHPWGEKSFLLIDPDGNRWEITNSPSADGMLVSKDFGRPKK